MVSQFGVCAECFASPLNCWFGRYCSAFPDCDAPFGSLGNFLNFRPRRGAFEANPPFAPAVLAAMRLHMHSLLAAATEPLSFVVAVAHWDHAEVRRAPVELLLIVLQNEAAASDPVFASTNAKLA